MQENSFLPSEEPQEQHQGESAQGILWWNLLFSISQPVMDQSSSFFVSMSHFSIIFKFCKWDISLQPLGDPREAQQRM